MPQRWLKDFQGHLQTDAYGGYSVLHGPGGAVEVGSWAHARREALARYLEDGRIEIDNIACERRMRGPAPGRDNWLFAGSAHGGETTEAWLTVIQSARLHDAEPLAYVSDLLERMVEYRDSRRPPGRRAAK